jgi:hypothetical protein
MVLVWIILGMIGYFGPVILMFYAYSVELKDKRKVVTIGDVWNYIDEEMCAFTFTPVIGFFVGFYYIFKVIFYKIKDVKL